LDLCCGDGLLIDQLTNNPFHINLTGIDRDADKIKKLQEKYKNHSSVNLLHSDVQDLQKLLAEGFDLIFCIRSLHFLQNIQPVLENVNRLLKPEGRFVVINFPIYELFLDSSCSEPTLNNIFEEFYSITFTSELKEYWTDEIRQNFLHYCDPERVDKRYWPTETNEQVTNQTVEEIQEISLLEIEDLLRSATVVEKFIRKLGESTFRSKLHEFYAKVCSVVMMDLEELLFEDLRVYKRQIYHIETHQLLK